MNSTRGFPEGTGFVRCTLELDGSERTLWVFVPRDYSPHREHPAILFLHGLFEAGHENGRASERTLSAGLGPVIAKDPSSWPFVTVFPQSDGTWRGVERQRLALGALEYARARWNIDRDRIILAGLSYGGLGVWEIAARHPDRFAALVPVSGHRATELVERLAMVPIWAFAVAGDWVVPPKESREMCQEITARGGRARLTTFGGIGHDCWDRAISESNLLQWMLAQNRRPDARSLAATPPPKPMAASPVDLVE